MTVDSLFLVSLHSAGSIQDLQTHASSTQDLQDFTAEAGISQQQAAGPQVNLGVSRQLNGTGQKAGSSLSSGKSASAEDLLERSEDRPSYPQHYRSRSSPTVERLDQVNYSFIGAHSLVVISTDRDHL